jgi:hypothetical protein
MRRAWGIAWRVVVAVIVLAVLIYQAAVEVGWAPERPTPQFWALVTVAVAAFLEAVTGAWSRFRTPSAQRSHKAIQKAVLASLKSVCQVTGLDLTVVGGSVFVVRRRFLRAPRLHRVERYRLSDYPQASKVDWVQGKGAIGLAWRDMTPHHVSWIGVVEGSGDGPVTEAQFGALDPDLRYGFTFEEFRTVYDKYAEVLAVPIVSEDGSRCLGVYAIDVPRDPEGRQRGDELDNETCRVLATECAVVVRNVLTGDGGL